MGCYPLICLLKVPTANELDPAFTVALGYRMTGREHFAVAARPVQLLPDEFLRILAPGHNNEGLLADLSNELNCPASELLPSPAFVSQRLPFLAGEHRVEQHHSLACPWCEITASQLPISRPLKLSVHDLEGQRKIRLGAAEGQSVRMLVGIRVLRQDKHLELRRLTELIGLEYIGQGWSKMSGSTNASAQLLHPGFRKERPEQFVPLGPQLRLKVHIRELVVEHLIQFQPQLGHLEGFAIVALQLLDLLAKLFLSLRHEPGYTASRSWVSYGVVELAGLDLDLSKLCLLRGKDRGRGDDSCGSRFTI